MIFFSFGRCYKIEINNTKNIKEYVGLGLRVEKDELNVYVLEEGQVTRRSHFWSGGGWTQSNSFQELCVQFGSCPDPVEAIQPDSYTHELWISVTKRTKTKR